ncbi:MAG: cobyrinate a,c-diamide synthase, partial [Pseudomonadota bacterium]
MADQLSDARGFIVAAPSSGSGKTTVTLGLIGALNRLGHTVATAKVGPDYIDPKFLEAAGGGRCINLDPWAMSPEQIRARLADHATGSDVVVIEGVMGLFDGAEGGGGATADLAALLELPIVLVVDASRQAQSIAALVHGFTTFRTDIQVAATIATRVGSDRHAAMIASALAPLPIPHLGSVRTTPELTILSRHLGLVQACEQQELQQLLTAASKAATESIDI